MFSVFPAEIGHSVFYRVHVLTVEIFCCICFCCFNSSLDWVMSHWAHFTVLDSFLYCVLLCVVCMIA